MTQPRGTSPRRRRRRAEDVETSTGQEQAEAQPADQPEGEQQAPRVEATAEEVQQPPELEPEVPLPPARAEVQVREPEIVHTSLIHGRYLIARAGDDLDSSTVIPDGAIFQRDGVIEEVGTYSDLRARHEPEQEIGGSNFILFPGLVNSHHHGRGLTTIQLGTRDDSLETWIVDGWARRPVDDYLMTLYSSLLMIESGTTTVMYNHARTARDTVEADVEKVLKGFSDVGMRVGFSVYHRNQNRIVYADDQEFINSLPGTLGGAVRSYLQDVTLSDDEYFSLFQRTHAKWGADPNGKVRVLLSPANVHWSGDDFLQRTKEYAQQYNTGIHLHLVESYYQKLYGVRTWGKTPLAHLKDLGFLGPEVSYAHGVWLTEANMRLLSNYGGSICHNASSNLRLKNGVAPVNRMLQYGINVAIGTDSDGINDDDDMFQEMRLGSKLHRQPGLDSPAVNSAQILKMATLNGAATSFFGDQIGALEPGRRADVVLMDMAYIEEPYLDPDVNILDAFLYRGRARDVDTVVIDGQVVLRGGKFTRVDKADVMARLKESLAESPPGSSARVREMVQELLPHVRDFYGDWKHHDAPPHNIFNSRI